MTVKEMGPSGDEYSAAFLTSHDHSRRHGWRRPGVREVTLLMETREVLRLVY